MNEIAIELAILLLTVLLVFGIGAVLGRMNDR